MARPLLEPVFLPREIWGKAPRNRIPQKIWRQISKDVRSVGKCLYCGSKLRLAAHETYAEKENVLALSDIQCVCGLCHEAIHFGGTIARNPEREPQCIARIAMINRTSLRSALALVLENAVRWENRLTRFVWLDFSYLKRFPYFPPETDFVVPL